MCAHFTFKTGSVPLAYVIEIMEPTIGLELEALSRGERGAAERETAAGIPSVAKDLYRWKGSGREAWSRRSDLNLRRLAGVSEVPAEQETAAEILSGAKDLYLESPEGKSMEPTIGLEPMTCRLRIDCSTN